MSLEDSSPYHKRVSSISGRQEATKKDLYEIFDDFRTNDPEIDPEIFRDDFNSHVVVDRQKSQPNFERDAFHNIQKLYKNTARLRIQSKHPSVTRTLHSRLYKTADSENSLVLVNRINNFNPRKSHSLVTENIPQTQNLNDLEPKIRKRKQRKHKHIKPLPDLSDEFSTSNAKFLTSYKKSKNSKENENADTFDTLVDTHKNILPRLNKRQKPRNHNNSESRHEKMKYSGIPLQGKEYNEVRHIQPELDIALEQAEKFMKQKQHQRENKKSLRSILRSLTTEFVPIKAEFTTDAPNVKSVNDNFKPINDEFALTILDINENQGQLKAEDLPAHQPSSLLDIDANVYQNILRQETPERSKASFVSKDLQKNKADTLKNTAKSSLNAELQPVETGMDYQNKEEPVNHIGEKGESDQKITDFSLLANKQSETILDTKLDTIKPKNEILRHPNYKNAAPFNTINKPSEAKTTQLKIAKKNFDVPLVMNDEEDKIASKENKVDLNDDFSKAEIVLTDSNESDKKSGDGFFVTHDQSDHEYSNSVPIKHTKKKKSISNILRYSRRGIRSKKSLRKCRRACVGSYTSVCRRLRCSPKAKRDLKYQCRKRCQLTFGKRRYSSSER